MSHELSMWHEWMNHLMEVNVKFKPELGFTECLSIADDRLSWKSGDYPQMTISRRTPSCSSASTATLS